MHDLPQIMKRAFYLLTVIILLATFTKAKAQAGFSDVIKVSPGDATKLIDAYGEPLFKGIGIGMNSGWTNTAKPKGLLHFELKFTATGAYTPTSDKSFDVTKIGLSNGVGPADPNNIIAPTIGGETGSNGPLLNVYDVNHHVVDQFNLPSGKLPLIPTPQLQLTVGLINSTDVTMRYIPKINFGGDVGEVSMIGFGVKHDLGQYIFGPAKKLVPFNLSVLLAYSHLNISDGVDVKPEDGSNPNGEFNNQQTQIHLSSFLTQFIISKKLLFFTPFWALGYNTASTNFAAVGNYPVTNNTDGSYTIYTNPVNIHENSISGFRTDAGFEINLGFSIYFAYSYAQYSSITGGIGFSF